MLLRPVDGSHGAPVAPITPHPLVFSIAHSLVVFSQVDDSDFDDLVSEGDVSFEPDGSDGGDEFALELRPYLEYDPLPERRSPLSPRTNESPGAGVGVSGGAGAGGGAHGVLGETGHGPAEVRHQAQLLIVSLIEKICSLYDTDPRRSDKIFARICDELSRAGIVSPLLFHKEAAGLRTEMEAGFFGAMDSMFATVFLEEQRRRREPLRSPFPLALAPPQFDTPFSPARNGPTAAAHPGTGLFGRSRYATEFEMIRRIGKGGFGQVCALPLLANFSLRLGFGLHPERMV